MLEKNYSDKHPDVVALQKEVDALEAELDSLSKQKTALKEIEEEDPENPAYINLKTQIEQTEMEIATEKENLAELQVKYEKFRRRVEQTPKVEQKYRLLQRDYEMAQRKYQESMARLQAAKEAKGLEQSQAGEKLTIINPPVMPEGPAKPNRPLILFIGIVLAGGLSAGCGSLAEVMDKRVRSSEEVFEMAKTPVLASIPVMETKRTRSRRRWKRVIIAAVLVLLFAGGLLAVHLFYRPLDILWISVQDKIDRLMI
jgi:uncharacterized protein involved in exopolysaccharide biosynthesis